MKHTEYEQPTFTYSDIRDLINEAMEKKDREVAIFISGIGTTIKVMPKGDNPKWTKIRDSYQCPECLRVASYPSTYCPSCGEKLYGVKFE